MNPICPYCGQESRLVYGHETHKNNRRWRDYRNKQYFFCRDCDAYVRVSSNGKAIGTLANAELRKKRIEAHQAFDRLWQPIELRNVTKKPIMTRPQAYKYLADVLGLSAKDTHISKFDIAQCEKTIKIAERMRIPKPPKMKEKSLETMAGRTVRHGRFFEKLMYAIADYQRGDEN